MSKSVHEIPDANPAIFALLERLADNKYFLGKRYAEWCASAPTLESSVAAAAMAQDELGHARALYPSLKTVAPDPADPALEPETRTDPLVLPALREPFAGWPEFVAADFLIDTAMTVIFEAAQSSSFEPLAGRSRKVLQEEHLHFTHGAGWVRLMAREGGAMRAAIERSLLAVLPQALCWLGPGGTNDVLHTTRVLDATPDTLRLRFLAKIGPTIETTRLALPLRHTGEKNWVYTESLAWDQVDPVGYRLEHQPVAAAAGHDD